MQPSHSKNFSMAEQMKIDHSEYQWPEPPTPVSESDFPGIAAFLKQTVCSCSPPAEKDSFQTDFQMGNSRLPKKRGRKPKACSCSLCGRSFPYKYALIAHLQGDHDIMRSTSVMYKRIVQGKRVLKRLKQKVDSEQATL